MNFKVEPSNILQETIEWVGNAFAMLYFASPLIEIIRLKKGKIDKNAIPLFLLLSILFNCLFWSIFAFCHAKIWISMLITNSVGLVINITLMFFYLYIFLDGKITHFIGFGLFVVNLLVGTTYLLNKLIQNRIISSSDKSLGVIAMVVNVIMYSSPITNIIKLCKFRSRKFLPIYTNIIGLLTTSVYILYGVLTENKPTWISNVASLGIIIIQICIWGYIYWRYPNNAPKVERIDIVENDSIVYDEEIKPLSNNLDYDSD